MRKNLKNNAENVWIEKQEQLIMQNNKINKRKNRREATAFF